ncbi:MAG: hypothetical protein WA125_17030 [Desulfosporosinus sp.]
MRQYVFVDPNNSIKGVCTADRELTADEVYPNMGYVAVEVESQHVINNFLNYEFDGDVVRKKVLIDIPPAPTETEILKQRITALEEQITGIKSNLKTISTKVNA